MVDLKRVVTHPISVLAAGLSTAMSFGLDTVAAFILATWESLRSLSLVAGVIATDLAPAIPAIPQGTAQALSLVLASLFVLKVLSKVWEKYDSKL